MRLFLPPTPLGFYSELSPEECERRLRNSIDPEESTIFSLSGYRGSKPFVGEVHANTFRVIKRIYGKPPTFPPVLTGAFQPKGNGTQVKGSFDLEWTSKAAICVFDVFGLLILALVTIFSYASHPVLLALFIIGYGSFLLYSPRMFRRNGLDQERSIACYVREVLEAD